MALELRVEERADGLYRIVEGKGKDMLIWENDIETKGEAEWKRAAYMRDHGIREYVEKQVDDLTERIIAKIGLSYEEVQKAIGEALTF